MTSQQLASPVPALFAMRVGAIYSDVVQALALAGMDSFLGEANLVGGDRKRGGLNSA